MSTAVSELYAPMIERDLDAIPAAVLRFEASEGAEELFVAIARFAVLAFAPSQHAKHAFLAVLSAHDLRSGCDADQWRELLTACARYASQSRQPWSEPPVMEPTPVERDERSDVEELRAAVAGRDRLRGERWLASHLDSPELLAGLTMVAEEDLSDFGHKVIVTAAAARLADLLGEKGKYAVLRTAIWELVAYEGADTMPSGSLEQLLDRCIEERGSLESAHAVFLFDARETLRGKNGDSGSSAEKPAVYELARDYGQYLKAQAVAKRLRARYPGARFDEFVDACRHNLEHAPSFEDWSFA